jgi:hypothetical protein
MARYYQISNKLKLESKFNIELIFRYGFLTAQNWTLNFISAFFQLKKSSYSRKPWGGRKNPKYLIPSQEQLLPPATPDIVAAAELYYLPEDWGYLAQPWGLHHGGLHARPDTEHPQEIVRGQLDEAGGRRWWHLQSWAP